MEPNEIQNMSLNSSKFIGEGLTYDDVLLVPAYSETLPREVSLDTHFTKNITWALSRLFRKTSEQWGADAGRKSCQIILMIWFGVSWVTEPLYL